MQNKGYVLVAVLLILSLMLSVSAIMLTQVQFDLKANKQHLDYQTCILSAKSAFDEAEAYLNQDLLYQGTGGLISDKNGGMYSIKVQWASETLREITVESNKGKYVKIFRGKAEIDLEKRKVKKINYLLDK